MMRHAKISKASTTATDESFEGWLFLIALLVSRLVLLFILARLTGGRDFSDDSAIHLSMARNPLEVFFASNEGTAHFPPLLPIFESSLGWILQQWVPSFYVLRLTFIAFEAIAFLLTWRALAVFKKPNERRLLALLWIVMPMAWMTSVVMEQEDILSAVFSAAIVLLVGTGRIDAAIVVCSVATVAAKIFFLVPLLGLVAGFPVKPASATFRRVILAMLPILIIYGIAMAIWTANGKGMALLSFTPPTQLSTSFWALLPKVTHMPDVTAKRLSMPLALIGGILPLVLYKWQRMNQMPTPTQLVRLMAAMWLWVFVLFYGICPEYYMMLVPLLMVVLPLRMATPVLGGMFSIAWAINFFYGVEAATAPEAAERKAAFIRLYHTIFPVAPGILHNVSLIVFAVLSVWLATHVTWQLIGDKEEVCDA